MDKINLVVGPKGSGKSTILRIINFRGIYTHEMSHSVKLLEELGFERDDLKQGRAWDYSALRLAYEHCLMNAPKPLFLSGCSRPKEVDYLMSEDIPFRVVSVDSPTNDRHKRVIERARSGEENISLHDFLIKDARRLGQVAGYESNDLTGLMSLADYRLVNDGALADLIRKVDYMLYEFGYLEK